MNTSNNTIAIKIKIFNKVYPLKINPKNEAFVRDLTKKLNHDLVQYSKKLNTDNVQDILAIACFDLYAEVAKKDKEERDKSEIITSAINNLNKQIDQHLIDIKE